jgi:ketosteroid isomerase-like protein
VKGLIAVLFALVILGLAFFLYSSPSAPPEMTEAEIAQIEGEVMAFEEGKPAAFSTLDPDRLMELWADAEISSVSFGEDRIIGHEAMQAFYENLLPTWAETQMEWLPGSTIQVLSPELALFQGTVRQATTNQEGVSYVQHVHFTDLLRKMDGEWKIQRNHVSGRVVPEG